MSDFERYRSFVAVYRAGTVSGAAGARFLTQPAVSQQVAALEASTGHDLFTRTPRGMVPTECGKKLYAQVAHAVDALEQVARGRGGSLSSEAPLVRLGAPIEYSHEVLLESILADASLRFWLSFGVARDLIAGLERGELDLVVATQRLPSPALEFERLIGERFVLVGTPDLAPPDLGEGLRDEKAARMERWLKEQRWVAYGAELPIIRRFWRQSFGRRPEIQPVLVAPDLRTVLKAVELGHGISVLPDYLCGDSLESGRLVVLWESPEPVENEMWTAFRKVDRTDEALRRARTLLSEASRPRERGLRS